MVKLLHGGTAEPAGWECGVGPAGDEGVVGLGGALAQWDAGDGGVTCDL